MKESSERYKQKSFCTSIFFESHKHRFVTKTYVYQHVFFSVDIMQHFEEMTVGYTFALLTARLNDAHITLFFFYMSNLDKGLTAEKSQFQSSAGTSVDMINKFNFFDIYENKMLF